MPHPIAPRRFRFSASCHCRFCNPFSVSSARRSRRISRMFSSGSGRTPRKHSSSTRPIFRSCWCCKPRPEAPSLSAWRRDDAPHSPCPHRRHVLQPVRPDRRLARRRCAVLLARSARHRRHRGGGGAAQCARRRRWRGRRQRRWVVRSARADRRDGGLASCARFRGRGKIMNRACAPRRVELVCPAGTPASLRTAVDAGADTVYCGLQNATNARNFPGLNFTPDELRKSVDYAHARGAKVLLAVNTFPPAGQFQLWKDAVGLAAAVGVDAIIVADMGVAALRRPRISAAAAAPVGAGRRIVAGSDPLPLRGIQRQARGAAADSRRSPRSPTSTARSPARSRPSCSAISA